MANVAPHLPLYVDGKLRVAFLAKRAIREGEELLWDHCGDLQKYCPQWMKNKVLVQLCEIGNN